MSMRTAYQLTKRKHTMSDSIPPTSPITNYSYNQTTTSVIKKSMGSELNNNYIVKNTVYTITVYDINGRLHTTTNNYTVEYTV